MIVINEKNNMKYFKIILMVQDIFKDKIGAPV